VLVRAKAVAKAIAKFHVHVPRGLRREQTAVPAPVFIRLLHCRKNSPLSEKPSIRRCKIKCGCRRRPQCSDKRLDVVAPTDWNFSH
jgi:hypothetical protein